MLYEANSVTLEGNLWRLLSTGLRVSKKSEASIYDAPGVFRGSELLLEHNS